MNVNPSDGCRAIDVASAPKEAPMMPVWLSLPGALPIRPGTVVDRVLQDSWTERLYSGVTNIRPIAPLASILFSALFPLRAANSSLRGTGGNPQRVWRLQPQLAQAPRVKRKMSNFPLRRGYKRAPLIDISAAIRIVKRRVFGLAVGWPQSIAAKEL